MFENDSFEIASDTCTNVVAMIKIMNKFMGNVTHALNCTRGQHIILQLSHMTYMLSYAIPYNTIPLEENTIRIAYVVCYIPPLECFFRIIFPLILNL